MPKGYTGVKESGGIDGAPRPSHSGSFTGVKEDNITPPTKSTPKGTKGSPWPKSTDKTERQ